MLERIKRWLLRREVERLRGKLMDHKAKTAMEGALVAVGVAALSFVADNVALLLSGDRTRFFSGVATAALTAAVVYIKARYATPPDVKERIDAGTFPERRDTATREEREAGQ